MRAVGILFAVALLVACARDIGARGVVARGRRARAHVLLGRRLVRTPARRRRVQRGPRVLLVRRERAGALRRRGRQGDGLPRDQRSQRHPRPRRPGLRHAGGDRHPRLRGVALQGSRADARREQALPGGRRRGARDHRDGERPARRRRQLPGQPPRPTASRTPRSRRASRRARTDELGVRLQRAARHGRGLERDDACCARRSSTGSAGSSAAPGSARSEEATRTAPTT